MQKPLIFSGGEDFRELRERGSCFREGVAHHAAAAIRQDSDAVDATGILSHRRFLSVSL